MTVNLSFVGAPAFIIFLILKLTGVIAWSWFYLTMPIWIGLAISVCILILCLPAILHRAWKGKGVE